MNNPNLTPMLSPTPEVLLTSYTQNYTKIASKIFHNRLHYYPFAKLFFLSIILHFGILFSVNATTTTWIGTSADWNTLSNWTNGVPDASKDVIIPSGTPNNPIITGDVHVNNFTIEEDVNLSTVYSFHVSDTLTNFGTFTYEPTIPFVSTFEVNTLINDTSGVITIRNDLIIAEDGLIHNQGLFNIETSLITTNFDDFYVVNDSTINISDCAFVLHGSWENNGNIELSGSIDFAYLDTFASAGSSVPTTTLNNTNGTFTSTGTAVIIDYTNQFDSIPNTNLSSATWIKESFFSTIICAGTDVTLSTSAPTVDISNYSFNWEDGTTGSSITVTPTTTQVYLLSVNNNNRCTFEEIFEVQVDEAVDAGSDQVICAGDDVVLTASSNGANYTWDNGTNTESITVSPTNPTTYTVTGTYSSGCTFTDDVTVGISSPYITVSYDVTINVGTTTVLDVGPARKSNSSLTYVWSTGETGESIIVAPLTTTTYEVVATDELGCMVSGFVTVTVITDPISVGNDQQIIEGDTISLTATGGTSYLWSTGATDSTIQVNPTTSTTYTVTVTDATGNTSIEMVVVTVIPSNAAANGSTTICLGDTALLVATGGIAYAWYEEGSTTFLSTEDSLLVNPSVTTNYMVDITEPNGYINTKTLYVTITDTLAYADSTWTIWNQCGNNAIDTDWTNGMNWSNGVPDSTQNALILGNGTFFPILPSLVSSSTSTMVAYKSGGLACNKLRIEAGASLIVENGASLIVRDSLIVAGYLQVKGTITHSPSSGRQITLILPSGQIEEFTPCSGPAFNAQFTKRGLSGTLINCGGALTILNEVSLKKDKNASHANTTIATTKQNDMPHSSLDYVTMISNIDSIINLNGLISIQPTACFTMNHCINNGIINNNGNLNITVDLDNTGEFNNYSHCNIATLTNDSIGNLINHNSLEIATINNAGIILNQGCAILNVIENFNNTAFLFNGGAGNLHVDSLINSGTYINAGETYDNSNQLLITNTSTGLESMLPVVINNFNVMGTVNLNCTSGQSLGDISASIMGGSGNFSLSWSPNLSPTLNQTGLQPDTYELTAIDLQTGCRESETFVVPNIDDNFSLSMESTGNVGTSSYTTYLLQGTVNAPYTYEWDYDMATISVLSTSSVSITTIDNGTFQVTVTDNTGCSSVLGNTLNNALVLSGSNIAPNTSGDSATPNGSIDLTIMGGVSPYELEWSNGLNTNETSIYNLASGWYFVNITDQDNNSITDWFWIPDASNTGGVRGKQATIASNMPAMYVYPSIANADASLYLDIPTSTSAKILLFNSSGQIITQLYEGYFESAGKYAFPVPIEQLANGIYFVHLQTQNGGQTQQKFIVVK